MDVFRRDLVLVFQLSRLFGVRFHRDEVGVSVLHHPLLDLLAFLAHLLDEELGLLLLRVDLLLSLALLLDDELLLLLVEDVFCVGSFCLGLFALLGLFDQFPLVPSLLSSVGLLLDVLDGSQHPASLLAALRPVVLDLQVTLGRLVVLDLGHNVLGVFVFVLI